MVRDTELDARLIRRRGKELRERLVAAILFVLSSPLLAACAAAILIEGLFSKKARGPVLLREPRMSRGEPFDLLKFRTLDADAAAGLTKEQFIATYEQGRRYTRVGRFLKQWYLDELPQLWNIVRGDMFLIGTRPWPIKMYEEELARGRTRKRDMPAGLIGLVQSAKGDPNKDSVRLDEQYWEAFKTYSGWRLLRLDVRIILRSLKVQLKHEGI